MTSSEGVKEQKIQKTTLREFIDKNYNLFTVMGVFAALTAFFTTLKNAEFLVAISFVIFLVLDLQIWVLFPRSESSSVSVVIFEGLIQLLSFFLLVYLYQIYIASYLRIVLPFVFFVIFAVVSVSLFQKLRLYENVRRIANFYKSFSPIVRSFVFGSVIGLTFLFAFYVAQFLLNLYGYP